MLKNLKNCANSMEMQSVKCKMQSANGEMVCGKQPKPPQDIGGVPFEGDDTEMAGIVDVTGGAASEVDKRRGGRGCGYVPKGCFTSKKAENDVRLIACFSSGVGRECANDSVAVPATDISDDAALERCTSGIIGVWCRTGIYRDVYI